MRLQRLDLHAFGHLQGVCLDLSAPAAGLTVVAGRNEAGKSTSRRAILAVLFGIPNSCPDDYAVGRKQLRVGCLITSACGDRLEVARQGLPGRSLVDGTGKLVEPEVLSELLGGVDQRLYERLFAFDHDGLRTGSEALLDAGGELGPLLFGTSLGHSVTTVFRELDKRAEQLFKPRGTTQAVTEPLGRYRDLIKQAKQHRVPTRDWDRLQSELTEAEDVVRALDKECRQARVLRSRLERARRVLPLLARRRELLGQLRAVEHAGPLAPPSWADRAKEAFKSFDRARLAHKGALGRVRDLTDSLDEIEVHHGVLERAARIEDLLEKLGAHKKGRDDLPRLRGQLQEAEARVTVLLGQLGLAADDGRVVTEADLQTVETRATEHAKLVAALEQAEDELGKAKESVNQSQKHLDALPQPEEVGGLERAVEPARSLVDRERDLASPRATLAAKRQEAEALAGRLDLAGRSLGEVAALQVPSAQAIADEQARRELLAADLDNLATEGERLLGERRKIDEQIAEIVSRPGLPDTERLARAREHREDGWRIVRAGFETKSLDQQAALAWAGTKPIADAYEEAVRDADDAADERYDHASDLGTLEQLRRQLVALSGSEAALAQRKDELDARASQALQEWAASWSPVGVSARSAKDMSVWREEHQRLLAVIADIRQLETELGAEEELLANHKLALMQALVSSGHEPSGPLLEHMVVQADQLISEAKFLTDARRAAERDLRRAAEELPGRGRAVADRRERLRGWQASWETALAPLGLGGGTLPEAASASARAWRALPAARKEAEGFRARIDGIQRDMNAFADSVGEAAAGLVEGAERDPVAVLEELRTLLSQTRRAETRRETLAEQLDHSRREARQAKSDYEQAEKHLADLREEAGLADEVELVEVADRSADAGSLRAKIDELEQQVLGDGGGRTLDEVETELAEIGLGGDEIDAELASLIMGIDGLEQQSNEATLRLGGIQQDIRAIGGSEEAADYEQEAHAELAAAAAAAAEHARVALAAEVLRRVVARYAERHRGPMVERASELFSRLTSESFSELITDVDGTRHLLYARRRNGEVLEISQLSDGTRDQLYLALRIAGIDHHLGRLTEPLPVVFDDVLVNFDDRRAAAGLHVLAELGERTQVLLFTHHESVVEAAEAALGADHLAVARIPDRPMDLAPFVTDRARELEMLSDGTPGGRTSGNGATAPPRAVDGRGAGVRTNPRSPRAPEPIDRAAEAVLEVLRSASRPLGKAEILELSRVPAERWAPTIRHLIATDQVVQDGQKKGARYHVPD
jgi:uncharacterized protein YhaN